MGATGVGQATRPLNGLSHATRSFEKLFHFAGKHHLLIVLTLWLSDKPIHRYRAHTMNSIEYSVSIIPEKGFQILFDIFDRVSDLLHMANERSLILLALSVSNGGTPKDG